MAQLPLPPPSADVIQAIVITNQRELIYELLTLGGGREVERYGSALAKLGGGMTDTALAMLTVGIAASHLRMHHRELRR